MSTNSQLHDLQRTLAANGVNDVKFFFTPEARAQMHSQVKDGVAHVLNAYLNGEMTTVDNFKAEIVPAC